MRKQLLGLLVPLLAFVVITSAVAADMTGKGVAASAALQKLEVAHSQDGLRVEFKAKGTLVPKVTTLDSPARIVVDFPNTVMATAQSRISVGQDGVKDVRVGMDGQVPPTTRVVVDLSDSRRHELVAGPDGSFTLTGCETDGSAETGAGFGEGSFGSAGVGTGKDGCGRSGRGREPGETFGFRFRGAQVLGEGRQSCTPSCQG